MTQDILIKNGRVIDPATNLDEVLDVLVSNGRITDISPGIEAHKDMEVIDAPGCIVTPGLIDCHVHLRESGAETEAEAEERSDARGGGRAKETVRSGTRAAAKGGFTTVICEPNTSPPIDSCERVEGLQRRIADSGLINVYAKAAMTLDMRGEEVTDIKRLSGHPTVKALSEDGNPVVDELLMDEICRLAAENGLLLSCHSEDSSFSLYKSKEGAKLGFSPGQDFHNEANFIARDMALAEARNAPIHISHVSLRESLELIRRAKTRGHTPVTCEATPHHLLLDSDFRCPDGSHAIVNPPLRDKDDGEALRAALKEGLIDAIASDHAPHREEDKKAGAPGFIGLETTLGLVLTRLVQPGIISLMDAIRMMSTAPSAIFRLGSGSLRKGAPADVCIIDTGREWTVDVGDLESLSKNSPFEGWRLRGRAVAIIVGGRIVMKDGELL
ncbi:MAG: dihydroorotase [Planctomycetota bacterium]|jgi:dihydroorotase